jgi:hypothetical protein
MRGIAWLVIGVVAGGAARLVAEAIGSFVTNRAASGRRAA